MKKTVKFLLILAIMTVALFALTACGENKLIATKEMVPEQDGMTGSATVEVTFENDETPKHIDMIMEFQDESEAEQTYQMYQLVKAMSGMYEEEGNEETKIPSFDVVQDGKKVTISSDSIDILAENETDEMQNKEQIKTYLESEGFTVK